MFDYLRDHYMPRYELALQKERQEFSKLAAEVMLELNREDEPELLYRIMRADIAGQTPEGPKIVEVNIEPIDPPFITLDGLGIPVTVRPAVWNGLEFIVDGEPPGDDRLLPWIREWLDLDDRRYTPEQTFQGVIHSFLRPRVIPSGYWTSVDFGSAPAEAVMQLIELMRPTARAIEIGSQLTQLRAV